MGGCHQSKHQQHHQFMFYFTLCLHHNHNFWVPDILDDVPQKNEYSTQSNHSNA